MGRVLVIMLREAGALTVACTHVPCQHITQHITNPHFEPVLLSKSHDITCEYDCFWCLALGQVFSRFSSPKVSRHASKNSGEDFDLSTENLGDENLWQGT